MLKFNTPLVGVYFCALKQNVHTSHGKQMTRAEKSKGTSVGNTNKMQDGEIITRER